MPRNKKKKVNKEKQSSSKPINEYFPPSPISEDGNGLLEITSETVFYNGPSKEEIMEVRATSIISSSLPTPDDSPEKVEVKQEFVSTPKSDENLHTVSEKNDMSVKVEVSNSKPKKKPTSRDKEKTNAVKPNHIITEFFPVRKSSRKTAKQLQRQQEETIRRKLLGGCEEGLEIAHYEGKGRGVKASKPFEKGDFIVEYAGDLVELKEAKSREETYKKDTSYGCYMYFFNHKGKSYCVDATAESGKLGRLLNHSRTKPNCVTKTIDMGDKPSLILVAARNIESGEELVYDYGERSKDAILNNPWLKE